MTSYAAAGSSLYNFADNSKYRGIWDTWLRDTSLADVSQNNTDLLYVCKSIRNFAKAAHCHTCRAHAAEYVTLHAPEKSATNIKTMFTYIVTFMNVIQKRKNAELYMLDIMLKLYDVKDPVVNIKPVVVDPVADLLNAKSVGVESKLVNTPPQYYHAPGRHNTTHRGQIATPVSNYTPQSNYVPQVTPNPLTNNGAPSVCNKGCAIPQQRQSPLYNGR
jgi:hypothetical protein